MKNIKNLKALTIVAAVALAPLTASAEVDFGERGEAVNLVIGYQPYYTESWTGVVNNGKAFWKNHLPAGSTAEFQVGLQGSVIVNAMAGEKQHIGYMGDMPAIASTFKYLPERGGTDIRIVAALGTSKQQCNIFLVKNDAPEFANGVEAVKWMDGKITSAPHGACTDRFAQLAFKKAGIKPAKYLNQNIEVITTNFRAGKLDAAAIWEPTATKMVSAGIARRAASGEDFGAQDGAFMVMLNDLIAQRPDAVMGWLEAELDAQEFVADPANADAIAAMAEAQTEQIDQSVLKASLYDSPMAGTTKLQLDFVISDDAKSLLRDATAFLYSLKKKPAASAQIRPEGVMGQFAERVLEKRGLSTPVGRIIAK
ncbi:MAG: ABC transporter substrate-binding protein [Paracoccaceae bacterium]|jgi:NitT/TauT family transport system substrate-binding protein|nr:ABC transporter substrate-binding protein [Paracoccaceae bacterium]MDG1319065.1 ABC transporter substrate-binding protein [Paracoccaceae bacterium]